MGKVRVALFRGICHECGSGQYYPYGDPKCGPSDIGPLVCSGCGYEPQKGPTSKGVVVKDTNQPRFYLGKAGEKGENPRSHGDEEDRGG